MVEKTTREWELRIGEQVRAVRIARSLTQAELARLASLSETSVRNLERGSGSTLTTLIGVARALGRTEWLDGLDERGAGPSPIELLRRSRSQPTTRQRVRRTRS